MLHSNDVFHHMLEAEFVTLVSLKVPSGLESGFGNFAPPPPPPLCLLTLVSPEEEHVQEWPPPGVAGLLGGVPPPDLEGVGAGQQGGVVLLSKDRQ